MSLGELRTSFHFWAVFFFGGGSGPGFVDGIPGVWDVVNRGPGSASDFLVVYQRAHLYCSQMVGTAGYQDEAGERRA